MTSVIPVNVPFTVGSEKTISYAAGIPRFATLLRVPLFRYSDFLLVSPFIAFTRSHNHVERILGCRRAR